MWESDTMDGRKKILDGYIYAQVFSNGTLFYEIYPMDIKSDPGIALKTFIIELGLTSCLTMYFSKDQNVPGTEFMKSFQRNNIQVTRTEP